MTDNHPGSKTLELERAQRAMRAGRMEEAATLCRGVLGAEPDQPDALHIMGMVALSRREADRARDLLRRAVQGKADDALLVMRLGIAHALCGDNKSAAKAQRRAVLLAPDSDEAHFNLALTLRKLGYADEAQASLERAVEVQPQNAPAWSELSVTLLEKGRLEDALAAARRSVELAPKAPTALNNLGSVQLACGYAADAAASFRRAIEQLPKFADGYVNLGLALLALRQAAEAVDAFLEALRLKPDHVAALGHLAHTYEVLNRGEEARETADRALALDPTSDRAALSLVHLDVRDPDSDLASIKERLELIVAQTASDTSRITALNDLARVRDRMGDHATAFDTFITCQDLAARQPRAQQIDRQAFPDLIARSRWFVDQPLGLWPSAVAGSSEGPLFVVGFPRSGTTLIERVLAAHPMLLTSDERPWLSGVIKRIGPGYPEAVANLSVEEVSKLRRSYIEQARADLSARDTEVSFVDKDPFNFIHLGLAHRLFPDSKVVFVLRDPRDVVLSCFMQWFRPNESTVHFFDLDSTARLYIDAMSLWRDLKPVIDLPVLEVRYEDFVDDFPNHARELIDFVGVDWDDSILNFAQSATGSYIATPSRRDVARNIYFQSVGRWRHYHQQMDPVLGMLAPFVDELGYADS